MIWLGGALRVRDTVVHHIGAQYDIPVTLLRQLALPADRFRWGKDLLSPTSATFAYYSFQNGFGFVDQSGWYAFDNETGTVLLHSDSVNRFSLEAGRMFQQAVDREYFDLTLPLRTAKDRAFP